MKKILLLLLLTVSSVFTSHGQQADGFDWIIQLGSDSVEANGQIVNDSAGNTYAVGAFRQTLSFPGTATTLSSSNPGDASIFLAKFNTSGSTVWAEKLPMTDTAIGGANWITLTRIRVNPYNGNICVVGNLNYQNLGESFAYFAMTTSSGSLIGFSDSGSTYDWNTDVAFDSLGNTYVSGYGYGGPSAPWVSYIVKFNPAGTTEWSYRFTDSNQAANVAVRNGAVYLAGIYYGHMLAFDTAGSATITLNAASPSSWNLYELKYSLAGHLLDAHSSPSAVPEPFSGSGVPPSIAGDFSPSGNWNVAYGTVSGSVDQVSLDQYGLDFLSLTHLGAVASSPCVNPVPDLNGSPFAEEGMWNGNLPGPLNCVSGRVYAFDTSGISPTSDSIPAATHGLAAIAQQYPPVAFAMDKNNGHYIMGEFKGMLSYTSSLGLQTLTDLGSSINLYIGKYHTCAISNPTITYASGVLTAHETTTGVTFQWVLNGFPITGAIGTTYVPTVSGAYSVYVTDNYGCQSTSGLTNVTIPSGVPLISMSNVEIYPNPASSEITITGLPNGTPVEIDNLTGQTLIRSISGAKTEIDISGIAQGVYFIKTPYGVKKVVKL